VTSFTLINADTDQPISGFEQMTAGDVTVGLSQLPTRNLNVRANISGAVASVRFGLNGNASFRIENSAPFALAGDDGGGDYQSWTPGTGPYTVSATPFSSSNASGTAGTGLSLTLIIVDSAAPSAPTNVRIVR
jgi:hypothetical protein